MVERRRIANCDALLVFLAGFVLTLSIVRDKAPVRVVHVGDQSFLAGNNEVSRLNRKLERWNVAPVDGGTQAYHWLAETSRFYAATPDSNEVWTRIADESEQLAEARDSHIQARYASLGPPPVSMGKTVAPPITEIKLGMGLATGLGCILLFAIWQAILPSRVWSGLSRDVQVPSADEAVIAIEIPAAWVCVKQPWNVCAREGAMVALAGVAIIGLFA